MSVSAENPYSSKPIGFVAREELADLIDYYTILDKEERARLRKIVAEGVRDVLASYREFIAEGVSDEMNWKFSAACRMTANVFDEPDYKDTSKEGKALQTLIAKRICKSCEVRVECLDDAIDEDSTKTRGQYGVYGIRAGTRFARPVRGKSGKKVS